MASFAATTGSPTTRIFTRPLKASPLWVFPRKESCTWDRACAPTSFRQTSLACQASGSSVRAAASARARKTQSAPSRISASTRCRNWRSITRRIWRWRDRNPDEIQARNSVRTQARTQLVFQTGEWYERQERRIESLQQICRQYHHRGRFVLQRRSGSGPGANSGLDHRAHQGKQQSEDRGTRLQRAVLLSGCQSEADRL